MKKLLFIFCYLTFCQFSSITLSNEKTDLSHLDRDTKNVIENRCLLSQSDGPVPYWKCLRKELETIGNGKLLREKKLILNDLVFYKGLYYKKISEDPFVVSDIPFAGEIMGNSNGSFINGKQEGLWVYYYDNGNLLKRGFYKNGVLHGLWEDFNENGTILNVGNYVNGKWDGLWKRFYRNGQLQEKGMYIKDKKDGVWEHYYKDGTPMKTVTWKNGVRQNLNE